MATRSKKVATPKRTFQKLPHNTFWVENDAYDRRLFRQLLGESPSFKELEETGTTLLPHFGSLLQDLFCALFKYNVKFTDEAEVLPSALLNQKFLYALVHGPQYDYLRESTLLNEARAGLAALILGERLLTLVKEETLLTRRDLRDLWDIQKQEELVADKLSQHEDAAEIPDNELSETGQKNLAKAKDKLASEVQGAAALLKQKTEQLKQDIDQIDRAANKVLQAESIKVAQHLEEAADQAEVWGETVGSGQNSPAGQKLELGRRLAGNEKLKKLAKLVGRMKFHAMALRKKTLERATEEILQIESGDSIQRLLPHELLTLHHPVLRKDFQRRLLDRELIQYSLRGTEEKGKGPMIVCLDGSSSMSGDKEIWSNAVALTLLEIARKQRRMFRSICFSSADTPLQVIEMNPRDRYEIESQRIMQLAEYFPGGGTDFQRPLDAAVECLGETRFKKGDIIFITDGECQVDPQWLSVFREQKSKLEFSLYSILIDVGPNALGTLKEFSDRITAISKLTEAGINELFLAF